jgi:hypothetical protein
MTWPQIWTAHMFIWIVSRYFGVLRFTLSNNLYFKGLSKSPNIVNFLFLFFSEREDIFCGSHIVCIKESFSAELDNFLNNFYLRTYLLYVFKLKRPPELIPVCSYRYFYLSSIFFNFDFSFYILTHYLPQGCGSGLIQ